MKPFLCFVEIKCDNLRGVRNSLLKILRCFHIPMLEAASIAAGKLFSVSDMVGDEESLKEELLVELSRVEGVELLLFLSDNSTKRFSGSFEDFSLSSPEAQKTAQDLERFRTILSQIAHKLERLEVT